MEFMNLYNYPISNDKNSNLLPIYSPLDNTIIGNVVMSNSNELEDLVKEAKKAQKIWSKITLKNRAQIFYKYRQLLEKNRYHLANICHIENGKTMEEALAGVDKAIELVEFACSIPNLMLDSKEIVSNEIECKTITTPLGIVASITPFNFPIMVVHWTFPIAIMMGNAIIVKPSEQTPISAMEIAKLLEEAGLPKGIFNLYFGAKEAVEAICDHPDIMAVSFVGSTEVAKIVYRRATNNLKRCLAMGGAKNHLIVCEDANIKNSARDIVASATGMAGQRCMAASVLVEVGDCNKIIEEVKNIFQNQKVGQDIPPIVSKNNLNKIIEYLEYAKNNGANILVDGCQTMKTPGNYIGPSLIDWRNKPEKMGEFEVFGPVLEIVHADNLYSALDIVKKSEYGNGASIFTESGKVAFEAANYLSAGMIGVNIGVPVPREPFSFGGIKNSKFGMGDITGHGCIDFFSNKTKVTTKWNTDLKGNWME